ncbi:hypothetical protein, partial [Clostridioides difficile]|uniref:hypothetical protein n=1 Tax=Clostridioides difficile TaxID=1496 RepID=UPI001CA58C6C
IPLSSIVNAKYSFNAPNLSPLSTFGAIQPTSPNVFATIYLTSPHITHIIFSRHLNFHLLFDPLFFQYL